MKFIITVDKMIPAPRWAAVYEVNGNTIAIPLVSWVSGSWWGDDEEDERSEGNPYHETFGLVVNDGNVVPAKSLDGFQTYDYDFAGTDTDYMDISNG